MQTRHEIDLRRQQQAGHEVGAIVTVGQQDVARTQSSQQLAQQGGHARSLLALEQHLRQERPQGKLRGVDLALFLSECHALFVEGRLNAIFRKRVSEGHARLLQKRREDQAKSAWKKTSEWRK